MKETHLATFHERYYEVPEWANYIAYSYSGLVKVFEEEPHFVETLDLLYEDGFVWESNGREEYAKYVGSINLDYRDSLEKIYKEEQ